MLLAVGLLVGCASANLGSNSNPDGQPGDSQNEPDTSPPDSAPVQATLQQTTNTTVTDLNSVACAQSDGNGNLLFTHANSWYRVYSLADAGITGSFDVSKVTFGVESSQNEPPLTIKVGSYGGTPDDTAPLDLAQVTVLGTTTAVVANTTTAVSIDAPITATLPAGGKLIVEITSTARTTNGERFLIGTTTGPFQHTNYLASATCAITVPTTMAALGCVGCAASQAIITVTGTH